MKGLFAQRGVCPRVHLHNVVCIKGSFAQCGVCPSGHLHKVVCVQGYICEQSECGHGKSCHANVQLSRSKHVAGFSPWVDTGDETAKAGLAAA
eukprot:scaffold54871_cov24-Tisochrysis_lutea.AAC.3